MVKPDNVSVHRAAANIFQAEKTARPAAPYATHCYPAFTTSPFFLWGLFPSTRVVGWEGMRTPQ